MKEFINAYMEAVEFTECHSDNPEMQNADGFAKETLKRFKTDCEAFLDDDKTYNMIDGDLSQAGHDFWLTRNGHGAGFWDGDWPEADGEYLTAQSKKAGECDIYVGDDNKIYVF